MAERSLVEEDGRLDEDLIYSEDYDLYFRMAMRSPIWAEEAALVTVRVHPGSHSRARVPVYRDWERVFAKTAGLVDDAAVRALCLRQRARQCIILSGWYAGHGQHGRAVVTLLNDMPKSARYLEWWTALGKTVLRPLLPVPLRTALRKWK